MLNVQGQARAIAQLQRSMATRRLASTWIFAGPAGVGKFTLAVELTKAMLCDSPKREANRGRIGTLADDFELRLACGACESCRAVEARSHPDLHVITKELIRYHDQGGKSKGTTLSIDVIRGEITGDPAAGGGGKEAKIGKRSFRGRGKCFLIDDADLMQLPAQNALLKTLEEPPAETYLVLITASPQELLSTIRSRSQIVLFNELPDDIIVSHLMECGQSQEDARLLARLARGSLGRALKWVEDMRIIDEKNARAADRKAKARERAGEAGGGDEEGEETDQFTPGGILSWTRNLAGRLDDLVAGRAVGSEVAAVIAQHAAEYSALALTRDKLTSADRARRDGIGLMMSISAEWFSDRMRRGLGVPYPTPLPGQTGALDYALVPELIASARTAEAEIGMNANDKILLAATATRWENLLREAT
jgi:DNA polymerase III delta prime subunit